MLELDELHVSYGQGDVLHGVSLDIAQGGFTALIGANGAGKSTLMRTVSGLMKPVRGAVRFEGKDIAGLGAERIVRLGISLVPEGRKVFAPLSVAENLDLGRQAAGVRGSDAEDLARVHALFPVLKDKRNQLSGSLSGGQQQMLAIGRALMGRPRVLMLDEPSLGLAPVIIKEVFRALVQLNREGVTILLVEQNARLALQTAHRAAVLEQGRVVHQGEAGALANDPVIADHYFGRAGLIA